MNNKKTCKNETLHKNMHQHNILQIKTLDVKNTQNTVVTILRDSNCRLFLVRTHYFTTKYNIKNGEELKL